MIHKPGSTQTIQASSFWEGIGSGSFANEATVETRLVYPLLEVLGYGHKDIHSKFPVKFHEGRKGRPNEADFAVFRPDAPLSGDEALERAGVSAR